MGTTRCKVQAGELLGATLSLFYLSHGKNSRPEGGAFIRSLQTGFLGKKSGGTDRGGL